MQPVLDETTLLQLPAAKYQVTLLPSNHHQQQLQHQPLSELQLQQEAVAAAAGFRAVAAEAAGMSTATQTGEPHKQVNTGSCSMAASKVLS